MENEKVKQKLIFQVGGKVYFKEEKRPYKIRACDERFAICTKPYNPMRTVLYTIIDLKRDVRGAENLIFGMGFETDKQCNEALIRLQTGGSQVSFRNYIPLKIEKVTD